ncbi:MAG: hypothetical protein QOD53_1215 [Thermoleophilaceae bacterium]|nr:hypothetical protein [Thermoleophilaceae bacterium]
MAVVLVATALGGCAGSRDTSPPARPDSAAAGRGSPRAAGNEGVIRGWIAALNAGRFERAAGYFAPGAVIQQGQAVRLASHRALVAFNRSLPCRADVTSIVREGRALLASIRLREGRGGACKEGGSAQVRFVIRQGRIREWRQLPAAPRVPGTAA